MRQFSSWYPLTRAAVEASDVESAAAIQVRRSGGALWDYPDGRSAMICYMFLAESPERGLVEHFEAELDQPGYLGFGPLEWRFYEGEDASDHILRLLYRFSRNFGALPALNQTED